MTRAILSVVAVLGFVAGVSAQARPNFVGKWKADGSFNRWTITVEGSKMTVTVTVAGNSESTVYLLDGRPSPKTVESPNGPVEQVYTSTWEDNVLVTAIKTGFPHSLIEKRWLEPDGTMRVQTILNMPGRPSPPPGPGMVFTKIE